MANRLRIATFNTAGITDNIRRASLFVLFRSLNVHVMCLQETHSHPSDEARWAKEWTPNQAIFNSDCPGVTRKNGVALLANCSSISILLLQKSVDGRVLSVDIHVSNSIIRLINIYGPTSSFPAGYRNSFFESLYFYLHPTRPSILAGDFNVVDNPAINRFPPSSKYKQSNSLINLCKNAGLSDTYRALYGDTLFYTKIYTFYGHNSLDSPHLTSKFQEEKERLASFLKTKHLRKFLKARIEYCEHGDRGTKELFKKFATQKDKIGLNN